MQILERDPFYGMWYTVNAAAMVGLSHEVGTIEVGKWTDLVVLKETPLDNVHALRSVRWMITDGIAKTPKEWMAP